MSAPPADVFNGGGPDLSGEGVPVVGAACGGAVIALLPFHFQGPVAVPVVNGPALGGGDHGLLDNVLGDADDVVLDPAAGLGNHLVDFGVPAFEPDLFNDVEPGLFDLPDLVVGEYFQADGPGCGIGCLYHFFYFLQRKYQIYSIK